MSEKKTVVDVIIDRILKDIDETGTVPWKRGYKCFYPFNYYTMTLYHGINKLLMPFGEYLTANQINQYNKKNGTDYKFAKGIKWFPVLFYKKKTDTVDRKDIEKIFGEGTVSDIINRSSIGDDIYVGTYEFQGYFYSRSHNVFYKSKTVFAYHLVADRKYFVDSSGNPLPSKLDTKEVEITNMDAFKIFNDYVKREHLKCTYDATVPCYDMGSDFLVLNKYSNNEGEYWSTVFHELAHSTAHKSRLNREIAFALDKDSYAKEECIAEICSALCCADCGIDTSGVDGVYKNNIAYIQGWKKRIKDWGRDFIWVASQAEKAYNYIFNYTNEE